MIQLQYSTKLIKRGEKDNLLPPLSVHKIKNLNSLKTVGHFIYAMYTLLNIQDINFVLVSQGTS